MCHSPTTPLRRGLLLRSTGFPHVCDVVGEHVHSSHVGHAHECLAAVSGSISSSMASSEIASARWKCRIRLRRLRPSVADEECGEVVDTERLPVQLRRSRHEAGGQELSDSKWPSRTTFRCHKRITWELIRRRRVVVVQSGVTQRLRCATLLHGPPLFRVQAGGRPFPLASKRRFQP